MQCGSQKRFEAAQLRQQQDNHKLGRVLSLFVDDSVSDSLSFGNVRQRAWKIISRDNLQQAALHMSSRSDSKLAQHWKAVDTQTNLIRRHLRPLFSARDFSSVKTDCPWLSALVWVKGVFFRQQRLSQRPLMECPKETLPKRLHSWLLILDEKGHPVGLNTDRYEFWLYRQLRKRLESGELYLDDSLQHRHLSDELVSIEDKDDILAQMDIPFCVIRYWPV
ncbi:transposase [Xenorhabdus sp. TS4]|nr:transposase [Xenorhabdus sp. TS4]